MSPCASLTKTTSINLAQNPHTHFKVRDQALEPETEREEETKREKMKILLVLLFALINTMGPLMANGNKLTVGDEHGWNPNVNYTVWEKKHQPFYLGDWLVFYYQAGQADVIQVDEIGYNKCDSSNPISNYSKGRSYAFELNETKNYYFICSYGYCYGGMKLHVKVSKLPPPSPPPSKSSKSGAFSAVGSRFNGLIAGLVGSVLLWFV